MNRVIKIPITKGFQTFRNDLNSMVGVISFFDLDPALLIDLHINFGFVPKGCAPNGKPYAIDENKITAALLPAMAFTDWKNQRYYSQEEVDELLKEERVKVLKELYNQILGKTATKLLRVGNPFRKYKVDLLEGKHERIQS